MRATDGTGHVDFTSSGRFHESYLGDTFEGGYTYENQGPNSGTLVLDYDDGDVCTSLAAFDSFVAGTTLSVCEDVGELELQPIRSWVLVDIGPAGTAPADRDAFDDLVDSRRLVPGAGSGFGVAVVFDPPGNFRQGSGGTQRMGTYTYMNTGGSSGTLELTYGGGGTCTLDLVFEADDSGSMEFECVDASSNTTMGSTSWTLEYAGPTGLAPADQNAFYERFRNKRFVSPFDPQGLSFFLDFLSLTRFVEVAGVVRYEGTYTYANTGANTADIIFEYDDGDRCETDLTFRTETSGVVTEVCMYDGTNTYDWQAM